MSSVVVIIKENYVPHVMSNKSNKEVHKPSLIMLKLTSEYNNAISGTVKCEGTNKVAAKIISSYVSVSHGHPFQLDARPIVHHVIAHYLMNKPKIGFSFCTPFVTSFSSTF